MDLSKDELEKIDQQKDMLKGNINKMCITNSYEGLELNYMVAKDRIESIYKILRDHLAAKYDKEVERTTKEEDVTEPKFDNLEGMLEDLWNATVEDLCNATQSEDWIDILSEMPLEQARQKVKDVRKKWAEYLEQEPCEDAISRDTVIERLKKEDKILYTTTGLNYLIRVVEGLPSVTPQPKIGHWIDIMVGDMPAQACDQCNTFYPLAYTGGGHKYCPNCGAKMQETESEE